MQTPQKTERAALHVDLRNVARLKLLRLLFDTSVVDLDAALANLRSRSSGRIELIRMIGGLVLPIEMGWH